MIGNIIILRKNEIKILIKKFIIKKGGKMPEYESKDFCFSVKDYAYGGSYIMFEPRKGNLKILGEGFLTFEFPEGTDTKEIWKVADYLNSKIILVSYMPTS